MTDQTPAPEADPGLPLDTDPDASTDGSRAAAPPASARAPQDDPEILALLDFAPVPRKWQRRDGWTPGRQRECIRMLAVTGDPNLAAQSVGKTVRGAYELRRAAGGEGFARAWGAALALHAARNPPPAAAAWPAAAAEAAPGAEDAEADEALKLEVFERLIGKYWIKLADERKARLAGRIAEADFYVRQLTFIEISFDLGRQAHELLKRLRRCDIGLLDIAATPLSLFLDRVRRDLWAEGGEPERPPLSELGEHDGEVAMGVPTYCWSERDGDAKAWLRRRAEAAAVAAEAQLLWEEKARAEAEEWRKRVEGEKTAASDGEAES
jgi:hypothetical protein